MATDEEAKAVQELAKLGQKSTDAVTGFGRFVERYTGATLKQAIGIVEDKLAYMRWERKIRLALRAEEFLRERGLQAPTRRVPLNVAVPLLEAASLEENDEIQDIWAALLVNAADARFDVNVTRMFVTILQDFGLLEALCLNVITQHRPDASADGVRTASLPESVEDKLPNDGRPVLKCKPEIEIALWNLTRLGCIIPELTWNGPMVHVVRPTILGLKLVEACNREPRNL